VYIGGASRGIGKAIATSFARGGASLIAIGARSISSLEPVAEELKAAARDAGRDASALRVVCVGLEASSPESVAAAAETVRRECESGGLRGLDVVVQNAAIIGTPARITDADPDAWWRVYEVNVRGQFLAAKYFLPLLVGTPGGLRTFVTVASVGAHVVGEAYSHYQSSKLANLRIAEFVDREYSCDGVSAWCVHPGNVLTDMAGGFDGEIARTMGESEYLPLPFCMCVYTFADVMSQSSLILPRSARTPSST
jgi:NAD(P)-dependent dehydrogenase (short-subunit alcohol dehydrogenase family)